MLRLEEVHTYYGAVHALKGVSLEVKQGEILTLIGANGAGKSTLMMTVCGDPQAKSGTVYLKDENITQLPTNLIMQKGMAIVPEGRRIFSAMTVEENLAMGAYFQTKDIKEELEARVLRLFPRLKERFNQRAGTMSGGEQQMLAIGRALMSEPELLMLDEPSLGLAPIVIGQIFEIIQQLREEGTTIFLVEQNAQKALAIADRAYVLEHGSLVMEGKAQDLLTDPAVKAAYLGG